MTGTRMNNREKVLSYLRNQGVRNRPVTNEMIAIGTRMKEKSVGPLIARMVRQGQVVVLDGCRRPTRSGGAQRCVMLENLATLHKRATVEPPAPVVPRKLLEAAGNVLEAVANKIVTLSEPDTDNLCWSVPEAAIDDLRKARDQYRDVVHGRRRKLKYLFTMPAGVLLDVESKPTIPVEDSPSPKDQ